MARPSLAWSSCRPEVLVIFAGGIGVVSFGEGRPIRSAAASLRPETPAVSVFRHAPRARFASGDSR